MPENRDVSIGKGKRRLVGSLGCFLFCISGGKIIGVFISRTTQADPSFFVFAIRDGRAMRVREAPTRLFPHLR